jgi:hypothetical protein
MAGVFSTIMSASWSCWRKVWALGPRGVTCDTESEMSGGADTDFCIGASGASWVTHPMSAAPSFQAGGDFGKPCTRVPHDGSDLSISRHRPQRARVNAQDADD